MARLTYQAPGVYVEEVPSARQPIAGVGTNTTAFIGIVGDEIYYPVPNLDYDPVAAGAAVRLGRLFAERGRLEASDKSEDKDEELGALDGKIGKERAILDASVSTLQRDVKSKEESYNKSVAKRDKAKADSDAAKAKLDELGKAVEGEDDAKKSARVAAEANARGKDHLYQQAEEDVDKKKKAWDEKADELQNLEDDIKSVPPEGAAVNKEQYVEKGYEDYLGQPPSENELKKSILRPYVLVKFDVKVQPLDTKFCSNFTEYTSRFGPFSAFKAEAEEGSKGSNPDLWQFKPQYPGHHALTHAVYGFFNNGGTRCFVARIASADQLKAVLLNFESIDEVAIIAAPGLPREAGVWEELMSYSETHENTFAILDSPEVINNTTSNDLDILQLSSPGTDSVPRVSKNAAYYFPHIEVVDPAKQLQDSDPLRQVGSKYQGRVYVAPSGHMAGIYARTDEERGVHKAPANCVVRGAVDLKYYVSKPVQELLNPQGINAIRTMNGAITVWGARTIGGDRNGEWKYISVRRFFLFLQESIDEGTQWVVFEPNDPALWDKIRLNISSFLTNVWRSGALFGLTPEEAFYVKCDAELNPPEVRDLGQVITEVGVAIVRPAEFVIFRISQMSGVQKS
jgi:phage tail sheath protein FI